LEGVAGQMKLEFVPQKFVFPVPHPINTSVKTIAVPHVQEKGLVKVTLFVGWFNAIPKHCDIGEPETSPPIVEGGVKFLIFVKIATPTRGVLVVSSNVR
jgi:hypothetical protein